MRQLKGEGAADVLRLVQAILISLSKLGLSLAKQWRKCYKGGIHLASKCPQIKLPFPQIPSLAEI